MDKALARLHRIGITLDPRPRRRRSRRYTCLVDQKSPEQNLREAIEVSDLMLEVRLQRIRETHPELEEAAAREMLAAELAHRPMDGVGVAVPWSERKRA